MSTHLYKIELNKHTPELLISTRLNKLSVLYTKNCVKFSEGAEL